MGASTTRKNRQTARNAGTDRKTNAQLKEEAKQKKEKIKWIAVTAVIVLFFAFVIYLNSGAFYRNLNGMTISYDADMTLGIEAGSRSFSVAECNYIYSNQYMNVVNSYGDYVSIIGIDTSKPLSEQQCTMFKPEELGEDDSYTWHDYFTESTRSYLAQLAVMEAYAEKLGLALDEDDVKVIDENIASFDEAKEYGYASADKFVSANYGKGSNLKVVRTMLEVQQLATKAQEQVYDSYSFTADELAKKYDENRDTYDKFSYDYYLVKAVADEVEDETAEETEPTYSEDALKAAKATADEIAAKMTAEEGAEAMSLEAAAKSVVSDAKITSDSDVAGGDLDTDLTEWLTDAKRVEGDFAALEADDGAYVVVFKSRDDMKHKTDESGDMNYCDFIADGLLRNEKLSDWNDTVLMPIAESAVIDTGFSARYIKR